MKRSHAGFSFLRFGMIVSLTLVTILTAAPILRQSHAQATSKSVSYDTPVESQITDQAPEEDWTLAAPGKDKIAIVVERTGGTLVPNVELRDSNNQRINGANADDTFAKAEIKSNDLPSAGNYTVAVMRDNGATGKTSGNYKLTVMLLGAGEDNPSMKAAATPITYDKPVNGEITGAAWRNTFTFSTTSKDTLSVTVQRTDGTLRPQLELFDSAGSSVTRGYLNHQGDGAVIDHFKLSGTGQFTLAVERENQQGGGSAGKYTLTLSLDGTGPENPSLLTPQGAVTMDSTMTGALTNAKWMDVWTMDAPSKDHILLRMTRTDGNLIPLLILMGANNQELQRGYADDTGAAAEFDFRLPGPGKYSVYAERQDQDGGVSNGKYELAVTLLGSGADNPAFNTSAGEVKIGTPSKGTITNAKWKDSWTLNVTGTDPVTIKVTRTSGTLAPHIKLLGANQQEINDSYPTDTFDGAIMDNMTLPGAGQYTVVVYRDGEADGGTSGAYELDVTQGPAK